MYCWATYTQTFIVFTDERILFTWTIYVNIKGQWLEHLPREREVVGSIPDRVIPKML